MNITQTKEYGKFHFIHGNRNIKEMNVRKLIRSITEKNMLEHNPIICNERMEVIDGQHRLEAAKRLSLPIYYTTIESSTNSLSEIHLLNANQKPWSMDDYMESYIKEGIESYKILKEFKAHYQLALTTALGLLSGSMKTDNFRNGTFKVENLKEATEKADKLVALRPYCDPGAWISRDFIRAIYNAWSKVDSDKLLQKIEERGEKIKRRSNYRDYLRDIEEIWNHNLRANQIRFY